MVEILNFFLLHAMLTSLRLQLSYNQLKYSRSITPNAIINSIDNIITKFSEVIGGGISMSIRLSALTTMQHDTCNMHIFFTSLIIIVLWRLGQGSNLRSAH